VNMHRFRKCLFTLFFYMHPNNIQALNCWSEELHSRVSSFDHRPIYQFIYTCFIFNAFNIRVFYLFTCFICLAIIFVVRLRKTSCRRLHNFENNWTEQFVEELIYKFVGVNVVKIIVVYFSKILMLIVF